MQVLRQFVVGRPSWRTDVRLHADAAVCLRDKTRINPWAPTAPEPHPWFLADSNRYSRKLLRRVRNHFQQYQTGLPHP